MISFDTSSLLWFNKLIWLYLKENLFVDALLEVKMFGLSVIGIISCLFLLWVYNAG